jgi:hypothetical protein
MDKSPLDLIQIRFNIPHKEDGMKMDHIHLIREVIVRDKRGRKIPTMQVSYSKPYDVNPTFRAVSKADQKEARAIYQKLGGGRLKEWLVGTTIIIPG